MPKNHWTKEKKLDQKQDNNQKQDNQQKDFVDLNEPTKKKVDNANLLTSPLMKNKLVRINYTKAVPVECLEHVGSFVRFVNIVGQEYYDTNKSKNVMTIAAREVKQIGRARPNLMPKLISHLPMQNIAQFMTNVGDVSLIPMNYNHANTDVVSNLHLGDITIAELGIVGHIPIIGTVANFKDANAHVVCPISIPFDQTYICRLFGLHTNDAKRWHRVLLPAIMHAGDIVCYGNVNLGAYKYYPMCYIYIYIYSNI